MFYVKKIWSLNPTEYKYIKFTKAMKEYEEWVKYVVQDYTPTIKTFEEWLKTEI